MDARVLQVVREMETQISSRLLVPDLAERVGLSGAQLTKLFLRDTGLTTLAYLQRLRMTRARWLLEHTDISIGQIMLAVGVPDRKHFARAFRLTYGSTPRMLRMELRTPRAALSTGGRCG